ncbi:MAG TPA: endolytic transglycosylase MltG [Patescibacteria group bacterium]
MKKFSFFIVMLLLVIGGIAAWWVTAIAPVDISDKSTASFVVSKGEGVREIATKLKAENLISNSVAFFILVKQQGLDNKMQAGDFRLSKSMNLQTIVDNLTRGSLDVWVTFPEGVRADEIADILQTKIPTYNETWRDSLNQKEGYLFPDTYLIPSDATVEKVITIMTDNFAKKYNSLTGVRKNKYTEKQLVTIASMVEREARFAEDRPLVASVIFNRLQIGMALNIDSTIQYILGYQNDQKTWWKKGVSLNDLKIQSQYNTYLNPGLPPTPIANPGLEALQAVVNAPDTNYLYYVSDKSGHNHYATTLQQHNANIIKYEVQ